MEHIEPFPKHDDDDHLVNIVIETPKGIRHKYAYNEKAKLFELVVTIPEGLAWPYDYGFVPGTLAEDRDPLDVLFLSDEPTFVGCLAQGRLLGIVRLFKDGIQNDRVVACAKRHEGVAQSTDAYEKIDDVPAATIASIVRFLVEYSEGAGHKIEFKGVDGRKAAKQAVRDAIKLREKKRGSN